MTGREIPRGRLKRALDALYSSFDFEGRAMHDPIRVPMGYRRKADVEAAAFIASCLAYGKVSLFLPVVEGILSPMGESPYHYLLDFDARKRGRAFRGMTYRFQREGDVLALLHIMGEMLRRHGSLERAFSRLYNKDDGDTGGSIAGFVEEALSVDTAPAYGKNIRPDGLRHMLPSPRGGGACKRINLFLRWMVRDRDIDFGIWRGLPKSGLVIPLDVHIARISRCLGLTRRKAADWKTAVEITSALRALDPEDPLKYDFALCHRGIAGICAREACAGCELGRLGAAAMAQEG